MGRRRTQNVDGISICERRAEVEDRANPGYWEGDQVTGSKYTHLAALVERQSRLTMLLKVLGEDTGSIVFALRKQVIKRPLEMCVGFGGRVHVSNDNPYSESHTELLYVSSSVPTLIEQIHLVMRVGRDLVGDGARK
jgi:hypothetical protein